jgi:haloalkane dehalogenase
MTPALRTPDERFSSLPGVSYEPHYLEKLRGFEGLRLHYVEVGSADAEAVFVCLYGPPTWAYVLRRLIPVFEQAGHRVLAADPFGFGRSDKPVEDGVYTFAFHRETLIDFLEALDLRNVCQNRGGLLGLTLPMAMPERMARLLIMNTTLGTAAEPLSKAFLAWRDWANKNPDMAIARLALRACIRGCPAPLEVAEAGHFVQEWGERTAAHALIHLFA